MLLLNRIGSESLAGLPLEQGETAFVCRDAERNSLGLSAPLKLHQVFVGIW